MTERSTRSLVHQRRDELCEHCGRGGPVEMHHRKPRSQRGAWTASNILGLCSPCHRWVTVNPRLACESGLSVKSFEDERVVPVLRLGVFVLLLDDGSFVEV